MNKIVKKFAAVAVSAGITLTSAFGLVACGVDNSGDSGKDDLDTGITNQNPSDGSEDANTPIVDPTPENPDETNTENPDEEDPETSDNEDTKTPPIVDTDDTEKEEPENPGEDPEPPTENETQLYDAQGNLNYAVFANTIKDWMNDGYYAKKISVVNSAEFKIIDYVSLDENNNSLTFGAHILVDGESWRYQNFKITSSDLYNAIVNGTYQNLTDFITYLNSLPGKPVINDGELTAYDTTITQADLFTMAENILTRLQEVGYQGESIENEGRKVSDYAGAIILGVRKDKDMGGTSGYDMKATVYTSNFYVSVKKANGDLENLSLRLVYKTDNASQNIIDNQEGSWLIRDYEANEIDYCPYTENTAQ